MKLSKKLLCLGLLSILHISVQAQNYNQSIDAWKKGDYQTALSGFRVLAEQGVAVAQFSLGSMYDMGQGVAINEKQAGIWFRKASDLGHPHAQFELGLMYETGRGVPKDEQEALTLVQKSAKQGYDEAQFSLALKYYIGGVVAQDTQQAAMWLRKAAEQGNDKAQHMLGIFYTEGTGVPLDHKQANMWFLKAAEKGNAGAEFSLGNNFRLGIGVTRDEKKAISWYQKAAKQGDAAAQNNFDLMNENKMGADNTAPLDRVNNYAQASDAFKRGDYSTALGIFNTLAGQGKVNAQTMLGLMYANGFGVSRNSSQAVVWYRTAAEKGYSFAQFYLAEMIANGDGVPQDNQQALYWYRKSAAQGSPNAQLSLGRIYFAGQLVSKDDQLATRLYRKAAEQGLPMAQHFLGASYAYGTGVPIDLQSAYFWWLLSSAKGVNRSVKVRDMLESKISPEQRAAAQMAASNWKPKINSSSGVNDAFGEEDSLKSTPGRTVQPDSTGSGFRVARNLIVTNNHVIDGCSRLRVNGVEAQVRGKDTRNDLALLTANLPGFSTSLRAQRVAVGEPVAVAGYPLRGLLSGFNMTTGNLSSLSGMGGDTRLVQITAPVQPGNSGGPVLDSAGNLMGVVVSKLDAVKAIKITGDIPQNVNFAINANVLRSFLDANGVEYLTVNSDKAITSTDIAEKAKGFTVLVECLK